MDISPLVSFRDLVANVAVSEAKKLRGWFIAFVGDKKCCFFNGAIVTAKKVVQFNTGQPHFLECGNDYKMDKK